MGFLLGMLVSVVVFMFALLIFTEKAATKHYHRGLMDGQCSIGVAGKCLHDQDPDPQARPGVLLKIDPSSK
jgi:hypothetical protein